ncbi:hypothetical protein GCWU000282_02053 [Catonella morbi ATCC 51271]|uniref:Uncharacterized protein n=1 Tax=Catonella morbi ATCC 51271 TaxID=592026 RepID=V2XLZ5_9FIRM|nr:hypothetical protein GCWU000282_02053 [Catonella morbi ATCC 51271]
MCHGAAADVAMANKKYFCHKIFLLKCSKSPCFAWVYLVLCHILLKINMIYKQNVIYAGIHTILSFITRFLG